MQASLLVLVGKQKGREIPLPETLFVIGRDPLCHLRPHSSLVSRRHCAIARWGGRVLVRDLKSANGTFLNHKKINNQVEVQNGDILDVGDISFTFQITCDPSQPVQELKEDSVQWLMMDGSDSAVLDPGVSTMMFDLSTLEGPETTKQPTNPAAEKPKDKEKDKDKDKGKSKVQGSKSLSAGKYLKDYLDS